MIDKATAQRIKDTAQILDVVGDYVHLTRRGSTYMGLCPFHNERTPSFSVSPQRNICHCFSCGKGGSPVNFIMEKEGINYHDALLHLAKRYGIEVEERELTDEERKAQSERESMLVANEWAMKYFEKNLHDTEEGRNVGLQYFYGRDITDEAIKSFHLGYAIDRGNAMTEAAKKDGFDLELLYTLGLLGKSQERGEYYDRFRGRVIYPIQNSAGKVIAFGGRDLKGAKAKYINSPESALYRKSNELYGIYQAKNQMGRLSEAFLVEGYMDVIGMWQSGMTNVVASSGTSLTDGQINLIHRFAKKVTLIYDGDAAGIKAALRGIDMLLLHQLEVKVLLLPDGDDPDSFARKHTPEEFRQYVADHATDIIRFKMQVLMDEAGNDPQARSNAIRSIIESIACIRDQIKMMVYIQECAHVLNLDERMLEQEVRNESLKVNERERLRRQAERIDRDSPKSDSDSQSHNPATPQSGNTTTPQHDNPATHQSPSLPASSVVIPKPAQRSRQLVSLEPYEKEIIRLCISYGMMKFADAVDVDGNETDMRLASYIAWDLTEDNIEFQTPVYARIFKLITEMESEFKVRYSEMVLHEQEEYQRKHREGISQIADRGLAMSDIQREEQKLNEKLQLDFDRAVENYTLDYVSGILLSHEDDEVRTVATNLVTNRPKISKVFSKVANIKEEKDLLIDLVPRALAEWKDGILAMRIQDIRNQIRQASADHVPEQEINNLVARLHEIQQQRHLMAQFIGDRVLSPR